MNLDAIKAKLSALNNGGQEREKVDYSATFWKPEIGKSTIILYLLCMILIFHLRK